MEIIITTIPLSRVIGVFSDFVWKQADGDFATHIAILDEIPATTGKFQGTIRSNGDSFYAPSESVFNATFAPVEEGFFPK